MQNREKTYIVTFKLYIEPMTINSLDDLRYYSFGKKATNEEYLSNYKNVVIPKNAIAKAISNLQRYVDMMGAPGKFSDTKLVGGDTIITKYTQIVNDPNYMNAKELKKYLAESTLDNGVFTARVYTKNNKFIYGYVDFRKKRNIKVIA